MSSGSRPWRRLVAVVTALALALVATAVPMAVVDAPPAGAAAQTDPLYPADFPDPTVLRAGSRTYAYATNGPQANVALIPAA